MLTDARMVTHWMIDGSTIRPTSMSIVKTRIAYRIGYNGYWVPVTR